MNYKKIYYELMEKADNRIKDNQTYYETHHIKPKSMGGGDDKDNLVKLTYREHFIAHWLLHRMFSENKELAASFHIMAFGKSWRAARKLRSNYMPSSRALAEAKEAKISHRKGTKHSDETLEKLRGKRGPLKNKRAPISDETREKMRIAKLGKQRSDQDRLAISNGKKKQTPLGELHHRWGVKHTDETKNKLKQSRNKR